MKFTAKTEYGLVSLLHMARHTEVSPMTLKDILKGEDYSPTFVEKILQKLKKAGIIRSLQGNHGGYVLAKTPAEISLRQIIEALEGCTFEVFCEPMKRENIACSHTTSLCEVSPIWYKTKELLDKFFGAITLEQIINHEIDFQELVSVREAS